eukprot:TRINITY_DN40019_c0_g1_i1.p1 TRINITY_DN40019_c0_g1~~TRINITY_DN40019_c0_g1_i1.p1  ORF type:complete len:636 (-),score=111.12 TRINITY_DN40019_c0_g1_i1:58-1965(-)
MTDAAEQASASLTRCVLHANVFEDGLAETPESLWFPLRFSEPTDKLLQAMGKSIEGSELVGFKACRDITQLPPVRPLTTVHTLLGFIDLVYTYLYHALGGEVQFGHTAPGEAPCLKNCLRCLFVNSHLADPDSLPSKKNLWQPPKTFDEQVRGLGDGLPARIAKATEQKLKNIVAACFDSKLGCLVWDRDILEGIFKREESVAAKWQHNLKTAIRASQPGASEGDARVALSLLLKVLPPGHVFSGPPSALIEVVVDADGNWQKLRSLTLHAAVHWLLVKMCTQSLSSSSTRDAFAVLLKGSAVPTSAEERAGWLASQMYAHMKQWSHLCSLEARHAAFTRFCSVTSPDLMSLVEFDAEWRKYPLPSARPYKIVSGAGQASVLYCSTVFERVTTVGRNKIPTCISADFGGIAPKSSAVALLRDRKTHLLSLMVAVHLESGPPSNPAKVRLRWKQTQGMLCHVAALAAQVRSAGESCCVLVCGDFNAVREEFLYGNGPELYRAPAIVAAEFEKPLEVVSCEERAFRTDLARDGALRLECNMVDGGWLQEVSKVVMPKGGLSCSRAGKPVTIDFIFAASVGRSRKSMVFEPCEIASATEQQAAGHSKDGLAVTLQLFGSDHLPVACLFQPRTFDLIEA